MPASVAGTDAGASAAKRKRQSTVDKEERQFIQHLNAELDDTAHDLEYIISELKHDSYRHIPRVAKMLRKGMFDKLEHEESVVSNDAFDVKVERFRNLRASHLITMLTTWEPGLVAKNEELQRVGRPKLLQWVLFGLGVKEHHPLPQEYPTLRWVHPFAEYSKLRYDQLGQRLQGLTTVTEQLDWYTLPGHFSLNIEAGLIRCNTVRGNDGEILNITYDFGEYDDWRIVKPYNYDTELASDAASTRIFLCPRFEKTSRFAIPKETIDWDFPGMTMPQSVIGAPPTTAAAASSSSALPAPPPRTRRPRRSECLRRRRAAARLRRSLLPKRRPLSRHSASVWRHMGVDSPDAPAPMA